MAGIQKLRTVKLCVLTAWPNTHKEIELVFKVINLKASKLGIIKEMLN
jgi:hypothetical protein